MGLRGYHPHRREKAVTQIETMIRDQELWGRRLPGEREMAESLGISRGTLQRALELLEAKGALIRRHGSGTFAADKAAARRRVARLAIITRLGLLPAEQWTYYGDMIAGAQRGCRRHRVQGDIVNQDEVWQSGPGSQWGRLKEYSGFVIVEDDDPALVRMLLKLRRGPVVILDSVFRDLPAIGVVDGSFEGARRAVSYLLHLGHRRIAYIAPGEHPDRLHEKSLGYKAALAEAGVPLAPELISHPDESKLDQEVEVEVERLLRLADPPTAIFAGTDSRALPAMKALEAGGRSVGEDFAVIGFGDSAVRAGLCDRLTSVRIHTRQMGEAAVRAALETSRLQQARAIIVPDRLIVRKTTCRLSGAPVGAGK